MHLSPGNEALSLTRIFAAFLIFLLNLNIVQNLENA